MHEEIDNPTTYIFIVGKAYINKIKKKMDKDGKKEKVVHSRTLNQTTFESPNYWVDRG